MVVSYVIVDKQCAWQQDRSPEGSDGPHCFKKTKNKKIMLMYTDKFWRKKRKEI